MCADGHTDIHAPRLIPPEPSGGQTVDEFCRHMLDTAQHMVNYVPGTDILTLRCFLLEVLSPEYKDRIDQICRHQPPPTISNININAPGNMVAPGAQTATMKDRFLPPPTAVNG